MSVWALVLAVAMALQGEAGAMGADGMYVVADSMLARHEAGAAWPDVLPAYYGSAEPTSTALALAYAAVTAPWPSAGMPYCLSETDVARLGLRVDRWHCNSGGCLGLAREWVRG